MTEVHWWGFAVITFFAFVCVVFILFDEDVGWSIVGLICCSAAYYLLFASPMKGDTRNVCSEEGAEIQMIFMQNEKPFLEGSKPCIEWRKEVLTGKGWREIP